MTDNKPLSGKTALITGASRGIGYATALKLAKEGAHIIAIARTVGGLEDLDDAIKAEGGSATLMPMDLFELDKIGGLGATLAERFDKIDILIGNAGMLGKLMPLSSSSREVFHQVMTLNVMANYHLIRTLHPLLSKSNQAQAIFLTAADKYIGQAYWGLYGTSKAALNAMVSAYANENKGMTIQTFFPGPVDTNLLAAAFPGGTPENYAGLQTPEQAADKIVTLLID